MSRLFVVLMGLLVCSSSVVAQPTQEEKSKALYSQGKVFFDQEDYQQALALFLEAYQLSKNPGLLPNIGQCHKALGQNTEAALAFQSFLKSAPDSPYHADVLALFKEVEVFLPKKELPPELPEEPSRWSNYKLPLSLLAVSVGAGAGALGLRIRLDNAQGEEVGAAPFVARASLAVTADLFLVASGVSFVIAQRRAKK